MKKINTLNDLLILKVQSLYDIESELVDALPAMVKHATDPDLKKGFAHHLNQTVVHAKRLEKIFEILDVKVSKTKSEGIRGIIKDAEWGIKQKPDPTTLDALLIASATYAEHYEMAGYISARRWAEMLGYGDVVDFLDQTLKEEIATADTLGALAKEKVDARVIEGFQASQDDTDE